MLEVGQRLLLFLRAPLRGLDDESKMNQDNQSPFVAKFHQQQRLNASLMNHTALFCYLRSQKGLLLIECKSHHG